MHLCVCQRSLLPNKNTFSVSLSWNLPCRPLGALFMHDGLSVSIIHAVSQVLGSSIIFVNRDCRLTSLTKERKGKYCCRWLLSNRLYRGSVQVELLSVSRKTKNETILRFTTRRTIVQSAVFRSHVVCLSICPSATLVDLDHDHIGWKSWKLIAQTISPTSSLFVAQRSSTYSQGNVEKF